MKTQEVLIWSGVAYLGYVWFIKPQQQTQPTERDWLDWFKNLITGSTGGGGNGGGTIATAPRPPGLSTAAVMPEISSYPEYIGSSGGPTGWPGGMPPVIGTVGGMLPAGGGDPYIPNGATLLTDNQLVSMVEYSSTIQPSTPPTLPQTSGSEIYQAAVTPLAVIDPRTWPVFVQRNDGVTFRKDWARGLTAEFDAQGFLTRIQNDDGTPAYLGTNETLPNDLQSHLGGNALYASGVTPPGHGV